MLEVADILRLHGPAHRQQHQLLPSQQKALEDLVRCRTPAWEASSGGVIATTADTSSSAITLAATGIVPSVTDNRPSAGWKSSANGSCPALTTS